MRKYIISFIILMVMPFINVNALECYETSQEKPIELKGNNAISNFSCSGVSGETLTFKYNNQDYSQYFEYIDGRVQIKNDTIPFQSSEEVSKIIISDGVNEVNLFIKNNSYIPTTTTTKANEIIYTVTLDNKGEKTTKTCSVTSEGETCTVTLPNLDTKKFTGWGKASSCKEGNIGSERINSNITYYACYLDNEKTETTTTDDLLLKELKVYDMSTNEEIDFGTFSIKKKEYEFKVLYEVENIKVSSKSDENITIEYDMEDTLKVGENVIIIKLRDDNNNTSEYKLTVTRLAEGETLDSIKYLKSLVIGGYNIDFNKEVFVYNLTIPSDVNKLELNPIAEDESIKPEIRNNNNLEDGSVIEIVLGDGEDITKYSINITKENNNILLFVAIGIIILLIIILVILIIIKTKNKKKTIKNNSKPETIKQNDNIEVLKF